MLGRVLQLVASWIENLNSMDLNSGGELNPGTLSFYDKGYSLFTLD